MTRDVTVLTRHLCKPAILVVKTQETTASYFGGAPPSYPGFVWPIKDGHPLSFLACFSCAELPRRSELDWLPQSGFLLFFYDLANQPWGFDPKDRGGWKTIYISPETKLSDSPAIPPQVLTKEAVLPKKFVKFTATELPPSPETDEIASLGLSEKERDAFIDYRSMLYGDQPNHQIGGYPDPVQNPDMDLECQLASHGLYLGDPTGYRDPRAAALRPGARDWSLLFQMDFDDDLGVMWGDAGMIYFWVRREDARARNFENTWLVLQCC